MNNDEIIYALKLNPRLALNESFDKNRLMLKRVNAGRLDRRLCARVDPSDVVQETLAEAFRRLHEYMSSPTLPFLSWLASLAMQQTLIAHRRHLFVRHVVD